MRIKLLMARTTTSDRLRSVAAVALIHIGLGYALLYGLDVRFTRAASDGLRVFDLPQISPPPPLEEPIPAPMQSKTPEGAAAPPGLKAEASPIVAPVPRIVPVVPPPIAVAALPAQGSAPTAGASDIAGPGPGAGGEGAGTGSGGSGDGTGGGGIVTRPRHLEGRFRGSDYPRRAGDAGAEGTVLAHYDVGVDGRVSNCRVVRSSGNVDLDETTCRLIERRFRYAPARDADGNAVPDVAGWEEDWWIGPRRQRR